MFQAIRHLTSTRIVNIEKPVCAVCRHFIKPEKRKHDGFVFDRDSDYKRYGKCSLFGTKDLVTGKIDYEYAINCRWDIKKCGEQGGRFSSIL